MVRNKKKIISIGGGGFTHETDDSLDQFVLNQLTIKNFKIGFLSDQMVLGGPKYISE